jgi:serine/threonine-protein kinase
VTAASWAGEAPESLVGVAIRELAHRFEVGRVVARCAHSELCEALEQGRARRIVLRLVSRRAIAVARREPEALRAIAEAAALDHPHVVRVHEWGVTDRLVWYAMPFVEGATLAEVLRSRGPLGAVECGRIAAQVGGALQYAHRLGVVHGDVRTASVLLSADGRAFLTDFTIARLEQFLGGGPREPGLGQGDDQRRLAALVWQCLTGEPPGTVKAVAGGVGQPTAGKDSSGAIPGPVREAVRRALSLRPEDQYPSVLNFVAALSASALASGRPSAAPGPTRVAVPPPVLLVRDGTRGLPLRRVALATGLLLVTGFVWQGLRPSGFDPLPPGPTAAAPIVAPSFYARLPRPVLPPAETVAVVRAPPTPTPPAPEPRPARQGRTVTGRAQPTTPAPIAPGTLDISSRPWGRLFVDGRMIGNTPRAGLPLTPGTHVVRVVRDGYRPFEQNVVLQPGQRVRLVTIVLEATP